MAKIRKVMKTRNGKQNRYDRIGRVRMRGNELVKSGMSRSAAFKQAHREYSQAVR